MGVFEMPEYWRMENYIKANEMANAFRSIGNTIFLALITTALVTVIGMMAAYIFARKRLFFVKQLYLFLWWAL